MRNKNQKLNVIGNEIIIIQDHQSDFISLTDIAKYKDSKRTD